MAQISALADTDAQSNPLGWKNFPDAGIDKNDLLPVSVTIRTANKVPVNILGYFRATVSGLSLKNKVINFNILFMSMNLWLGLISRILQLLNS